MEPAGTTSGEDRTRLYLVRHGRTSLNAAGVLRGLLDPPLDELGRMQAARLAAVLGTRVQLVVASPLRRAVATAEAIAAPLALLVETDRRLIDRDYGRWAGAPREEIVARFGSLDAAPGVEPAEEVRARACSALADLAARAAGGVAVAVSHDAVIRLSLVALDPLLGDPDSLSQETGCANTIEVFQGRWRVDRVNELPAPAGGSAP
jgi:broad specificity phosphatase PhoE